MATYPCIPGPGAPGSGCLRIFTWPAIYLLRFTPFIFCLRHHIHLETALPQYGQNLPQRVPSGFLIRTDVDAFGRGEALVDHTAELVDVDRLLVQINCPVAREAHHRHY